MDRQQFIELVSRPDSGFDDAPAPLLPEHTALPLDERN